MPHATRAPIALLCLLASCGTTEWWGVPPSPDLSLCRGVRRAPTRAERAIWRDGVEDARTEDSIDLSTTGLEIAPALGRVDVTLDWGAATELRAFVPDVPEDGPTPGCQDTLRLIARVPIRITTDSGHAEATVSGWLEVGGDPPVTWASSAIELQDVDPGLLDRAEDVLAAEGRRRSEVVGLALGLVASAASSRGRSTRRRTTAACRRWSRRGSLPRSARPHRQRGPGDRRCGRSRSRCRALARRRIPVAAMVLS